jgi:hypothetical protein
MKSEVYSWRLEPEKKADLENELRHEGTTLSKLLDDMTDNWLHYRRNGRAGDDAQLAALRRRVMATVGTIHSARPHLASKSREIVRERVVRKLQQELHGSRRTD